MASLAEIVLDVQRSAESGEQPIKDVLDAVTTDEKDSTATPVNPADASGSTNLNTNHPNTSSSSLKCRSTQSSYKETPIPHLPAIPSERSGPPLSISLGSIPNSHAVLRLNSRIDTIHPQTEISPVVAGPSTSTQQGHDQRLRSPGLLGHTESPFRDALEYDDPDQREREREYFERVESRKLGDSRFEERNPIGWITDSPRDTPKEGRAHFELGAGSERETEKNERRPKLTYPSRTQPDNPPPLRKRDTTRSNPLPPAPTRQDSKDKDSQAGSSSTVAPHSVNITDELITGGLATLMLKLWFERDEKGHRRVPILLHRLRIRISDSLHPLDRKEAVFRIECEYANGAASWVVYRQLREFLSLHTHYAIKNAFNRNVVALPEFPKTGSPYFKFLKEEGKERGKKVGHVEFARIQREVLETYLVGLIHAVMFHSIVNRLAAFLEISALSIALAQSGGVQYKAGFLHLEISKGVGLGSKSASRNTRDSQKWCSVRESYLVISGEPAELTVFDVFLLDSDFEIERPTRKGLHLPRDGGDDGDVDDDDDDDHEKEAEKRKGKKVDHLPPGRQNQNNMDNAHLGNIYRLSTLGSVGSKISNVFKRKKAPDLETPSRPSGSGPGRLSRVSTDDTTSTVSSRSERGPNPVFDRSTNTKPFLDLDEHQDYPSKQKWSRDKFSGHTFYIKNAQMKLKISAKSERQMLQWIAALEKAAAACDFTRRSRFDGFAPIRLNVAAQWLVDGRDYFWNLSRAILLAKQSIYIHDWWLSPELRLRRPGKEKYRLDRLLQKKAQEGVKIYIILYHEVSNRTTPTDSGYTKQRLMGLHGENIMVQRSPSHFQTGTFYWAHHEKMCVIDQTIAFIGGLDMCFGRWDTPQHVLVDDPDTQDSETSENLWPGKDYNNGRILDFHTLNKPEQDMYDRGRVPRMPWHDVGIQVVGQPARDIARHFTERWNYLLRIKDHSRVMPCLLPPPEFKPGELNSMGLTGTCEMQIVRSAGPWSLGTPDRIEHSIQSAYFKAIQLSEHFVYIENQFFITSTVVNGVKVENRIGDAIVHRVIRAYQEGTPWKCCIVIPLLPGFPFPVDHSDASSVRITVECQNRSICRGPYSIFSRLRKEGIDPSDYISVFSLRNWAKLRGNILTTEQVYIHAKVCLVDDRLAIIGSADINERSQRGDRDSELAAVIRDVDMIDGSMAGKPFKVGRFVHTLRVRLMREHLGIDVDSMNEEDLMATKPRKPVYDQRPWDLGREESLDSIPENSASPKESKGEMRDQANAPNQRHRDAREPQEHGTSADSKKQVFKTNGDGQVLETKWNQGEVETPRSANLFRDPPTPSTNLEARMENEKLHDVPASRDPGTNDQPTRAVPGMNDAIETEERAVRAGAEIRKHLSTKLNSKIWTLPTPTPKVDPHGFEDPICDEFWKVWIACAVHNTEIYRKVFHAVPDDIITTWKQYKDFILHHEHLSKPAKDTNIDTVGRVSDAGDEQAPESPETTENLEQTPGSERLKGDSNNSKESISREPSTTNMNGDKKKEMVNLLGELRGNLVIYSTRFLEGEDSANNFLSNTDRLLPLQIYN